MPIQTPQWADYLNCGVCGHEYGAPAHCPISLSCGHTLCRSCLLELPGKLCPFDQIQIHTELEELVVNTALLFLAGYSPPAQPYRPPAIKALPSEDQKAFDIIVQSLEELASYVKYYTSGQGNNNECGCRLSRPMQRKLMALVQCGAPIDSEGRSRVARAARSLAERTVTELILQHQNPQQLSVNLWAAVRARGCQFLGPAMQEEVLKLVLLALEDGTALSRKVLVMFVVQRLEAHFPQASKTSVGHVVQLLYRASCFKVSKRERDSSLMQLKEEFRTYETLRREHDAQIVQIATESGLRIGPDQWSALLYGDTAHKSHMQSIIDKMQIPQTLVQSVQELILILHRTGDQNRLMRLHQHLDKLVVIDSQPDAKSPSWQTLGDNLMALKEVVGGYLQHHPTPVSRDGRTQHNNGRTDHNLSNEQDAIPYYGNNETSGTASGVYEIERVIPASQRNYQPLMEGGAAAASAPYGVPVNEPGYPPLQLQLPEPQPVPAWPHVPHVNMHPVQQQPYYQLAGNRNGPVYAQFVPPMPYSPWPVMHYQPPEFQMSGNGPWPTSFQPSGDYPTGYRYLTPNMHLEVVDGVRSTPWPGSEQTAPEMMSQQHLPQPPTEWLAPPPSCDWIPVIRLQARGAGDDNADDVELEIRLGEMEQRLGHVLDTAEA